MKRDSWDTEKTNPSTIEKFSNCEVENEGRWVGNRYIMPEYEQPQSASIEDGHSGIEPMHKNQRKLY